MSYHNNNNNNQGSNVQGEAASYYAAAAQQTQQHYQGSNQQHGDQQERGFLGAVGGGIAGGFGGNKIGGKTGHSKLSTVLGAVAGAVAGHKLQDGVEDWKDKKDEEKEKKKKEEEDRIRREEEEKRKREEDEKRRKEDDDRRRRDDEDRKRRDEEDRRRREEEDRRRASQPQQQQQHHHSNQPRDHGVSHGGNFSGSAKDIRLDAHGEFMLHCECRRLDGSYQPTSISLNKIIENSNGNFRWTSGGANINSCGNKPSSVTVQPGDTLRDIAQRHGTNWQELAKINCLQNPDLIHPGQVIKLPGGGSQGGQAGGNFGSSARNVRLEDCGKRLVAELRRGDGCWVSSSLNLDERIGNANGTLQFK
ncbi:hypothetical protein QC764_101210 [Podospora pseudoanserina]|uniref:LysM domain-containing protein n=1 Tax=Podospora pseudoanserina TaxID=2609844 RepID=A0ABR0IKM7_9PEZI|nr:hypothetical protein QC764_101210 [Podospora pseudoanserina]